MKKLSYVSVLLAAIVLFTFTACEKDGVYNPKKKISRIFHEGSSGKYLSQTWTWDKNLLDKIDYGDGYFDRFVYDGKRISSIVSSDLSTTTTFSYDGSKLSKMEVNYKSSWSNEKSVYQFVYDGKKVSKIEITEYYDDKDDWEDWDYASVQSSQKAVKANASPLRLFFSEQTCMNIEKFQKTQKARKSRKDQSAYNWTIYLKWDGSNVIEEKIEEIDEDGVWTMTSTYTYDKKKNPFCGLFDEDIDIGSFSKNNATKMTLTSSGGYYTEFYYEYKYDGNFPTECRQTEMNDSYFYTTHYEYTK